MAAGYREAGKATVNRIELSLKLPTFRRLRGMFWFVVSSSLGQAFDHSSDIRSDTLSQFCGLEHFYAWTETQDEETGVVFIFELSMHGDPSLRVGVLPGRNLGKASPRFHRFGSARLQSQYRLVSRALAKLCCGRFPVGG
jgi:hypothetical protein